jgi:hypothetical protein
MKSLESKLRFDDSRGLDSCSEYVLLRGHVVWAGNPVERVQVVGCRVVELVLARSGEAVLHPLVMPEAAHQLTDLVCQLDLVALARHLEKESRVVLDGKKKPIALPLAKTKEYINGQDQVMPGNARTN